MCRQWLRPKALASTDLRDKFIPQELTFTHGSVADFAKFEREDMARAQKPRLPPIGRLIQPGEIAAVVAYLLSSAAAAITGQDTPFAAALLSTREKPSTRSPMKIVNILESTRPIKSDIRNAFIDFSKMTLSLVAVVTDVVRDGKPVVGYGFNSNGRYGQGGLIRERFAPRLLEAEPDSLLDEPRANLDPRKAWARMMLNEKPGGHGERSVAVGTIDMAIWDAVAKIQRKPLFQLLAERYGNGTPNPRVFVYAAGGYYYPGKGVEGLQREMTSYLERGYSVVKMKIGGAPLADDCRRIESVLKILGPGQQLAVDANGRFDLATAVEYARALSQYPLFWYEEAGDPLDYELQAELSHVYAGSMATGENLFSTQDARNLIRYGGMRPDRDWLQFDCALSYGLVEYLRTLRMLQDYGWSASRCIPHGGHQMSLAIAAGLGLGGNESYPDLFQPYGGFPDGVVVRNGHVELPPLPGIGFEGKADLIAEMRALAS